MSFVRQFVLSKDKAYLTLPGTAGNYASTPDSAAVSVTGDIDIRVKLALDDWTPAFSQGIAAKSVDAGDQRSIVWNITSVVFSFFWSADGINYIQANSTATIDADDGSIKWVRVTLDVDNGASGRDIAFYTSDDGETWTQLGETVTQAGTTSIFDSTADWVIGADRSSGASTFIPGKVYYAELRDGIDGSVVAKFDPANDADPGDTSFTSSTGEVWTINQSGSPEASIAGSGRVNMNTGTVATEATINGQAYMSSGLAIFVDTGAVDAADAFIGGWRYTSEGALRVHDATAADPSPLLHNNGIAMTEDGQVAFSQNTAATVYTINGVSVSGTGVVYADTF